jgi:NAD(P)H-hydrate epimerase
VVALGPGLGRQEWGQAVFAAVLRAGRPGVLDADGLNLLALSPHAVPASTVLTPHPGEAARLLGIDVESVQRDRYAAVRELARRYQSVCVLKGAGSLVGSPGGRVMVCPWGNPGMASGGMGDVLTGVIAALLAQGLDAWDAACLGVALHARAGDLAAGTHPRGLVASDLYGPLRELANGALS